MPDKASTAFSLIAMDLDVNTLFMVTMHVEIMLGLLLFFAWAQNFSKRALAWWGSAHLMRAVSIMLLGLYGSVPDSLSIDFANAVLFGSFALTWCGARVFDRRSAGAGAGAGRRRDLAAGLPPAGVRHASVELRVLVGSGIVTAYTWAAAYEFWRGRDEALVSRWPAIFMLFAHGALFLLRTPLGAVAHVAPGNNLAMSGWLELLSLEALLFTISIAFILLAMAKERTEYRHRTAARTDPLTGIANRRGFLEQTALSRRAAAGAPADRGAAVRSRSFQADQRSLRSRRRRPHAADFRRHRQGAYRRGRNGRPLGRRRVRRGAVPTPAARSRRRWRSASRSRSRRPPPTSTAGWSAPRSAPAWRSAATARSSCRPCCCRPTRRSTAPRNDGRNRLAIAMSDIRSSSEEDPAHIVTLRRRDAA